MSKIHKRQLFIGVFWVFIGQIAYLLVSLVTNIILARLLSPYEFGQVAIVFFFIVISQELTDSGLGGSLIRNPNTSSKDYSTIFIFNLAVSLILVIVLALSAGVVAAYYNDLELKNILLVSSLIILINSFQIVQSTRLIKNMHFKRKALYDFIAVLVSSVISIIFAYHDYGVWSLVIYQISISTIQSTLYWVFEGGFGPWVFDKGSFKMHYKFGLNTTLANLLNTFFDNIYQLIFGKYFSISQTGLFYQAKKLQAVPIGVIQKIIHTVIFSSLSKIQHNAEDFKKYYQKIVTFFTISSGLICLLIFLYAENLILLVYGSEWIEATLFMKVLILSSFFYLQESFNRVVFKVYDKTEIILKLEFVKKGIQLITILIGMLYLSMEVLVYGILVTSVISYYVNFLKSRRMFISLGWFELRVLLKVITIAVVLSIISFTLSGGLGNQVNLSLLYAPLIIIIYYLSLWILRVLDPVDYYKSLIFLLKRQKK